MSVDTDAVTKARCFTAPRSVREALENVATLLGDREDARTDYGMLMVACYGPLFRWDSSRERYTFRARREFPPGYRDAVRAAAQQMTADVVRTLGGERGATLHDVLSAIRALDNT